MRSVQPCPLPAHALLSKYTHTGAYTDCYTAQVPRPVSHAEFVETFYTGTLFRIERRLLGWLLAKPSTDAQARELAAGERLDFAAWRVESRGPDQLLLCDIAGRTRSWLMVAAAPAPAAAQTIAQAPSPTRLYFGSAVVPVLNRSTGRQGMGFWFNALLGFHKLYSRALLASAQRRLTRAGRRG